MLNKFHEVFLFFVAIIAFLLFYFFSNNVDVQMSKPPKVIANQSKILIDSFFSNNVDVQMSKPPKVIANQSKILIDSFFNSIKEKKIFSQNKEDGVILSLLSLIGLPQRGSFIFSFNL